MTNAIQLNFGIFSPLKNRPYIILRLKAFWKESILYMRSWSFQMVDHFHPFSMLGSFCKPFSLGHRPQGQGLLRDYELQGNGALVTIKARMQNY